MTNADNDSDGQGNTGDLARALYQALVSGLWEMETRNYNVRGNYPEFLKEGEDLKSLSYDEVMALLSEIERRSRDILENEKPPKEPEVNSIFEDATAHVPNNPFISAVFKAIFHGGKQAGQTAGGWFERGGKVRFEDTKSTGGTVTITLDIPADGVEDEESVEQQWRFVQGLSAFTADVLMGVLCQIGNHFYEKNTDKPHMQTTVITSKQILKDKPITRRGDDDWKIRERVGKEIDRICCLNARVKGFKKPRSKKDNIPEFSCRVIKVEPCQERFSRLDYRYVTTAWEVKPDKWSEHWMSTESAKFIGVLHPGLYGLDYRDQRGAELMAKKIGYLFLTVPRGTYPLQHGLNKSVKNLMESIGDYTHPKARGKDQMGRKVKNLVAGIEVLAGSNLIETPTQPINLIEENIYRDRAKKTLAKSITIQPGPDLKVPK